MKWPFGGSGAAVAELEPEPEVDVVDDKPRLMMLAADASGLASFKHFNFRDSDEAVDFIHRSYGGRSDTGLIAFWAMTEQPVMNPAPGADTELEVMVMIRDDIRNDVVYPFSFTDIENAHGFVKHEMERGLDPNHVMLYWAAPVQLGITADGAIALFPKAPPTSVDYEATSVITRVPGEEPMAEAIDSGDFMQSLSVSVAVEGPLVSTEEDPIEALFAASEEPVAEAAATRTAIVQDETEQTAAIDEIAEFEGIEETENNAGGGDETNLGDTVEAFAEEAELTEEAVEEESGADVALIEEETKVEAAVTVEDVPAEEDFSEVVAEEEPAEAELSETVAEETTMENNTEEWDVAADDIPDKSEATKDVREPVAAIAARQWISDGPVGTEFPAGRAYARSEAELNDVSDDVQRVLRVRRWEESTEPFRGFESPPGRF